MSELPSREYHVLSAIHEFFVRVISDHLQHEVPIPVAVRAEADGEGQLALLHRWVNVLDLAVTPPALRDALNRCATQATAESLLWYYARKAVRSESDRDKADYVVTWLYRNPEPPGQWNPLAFEAALAEFIGSDAVGPLPEEHAQLVREFEFIREEMDDTRHFDTLMDCGIVQRVRDIKAAFGGSFYHPKVLATVAAYNVFFGTRFDELFHAAAAEIKSCAEKMLGKGNSVLARVEGDVILKNLADVEEEKIMSADYRSAQDQFRNVSRLKKAVDSRRKREMMSMTPMVAASVASIPDRRTPSVADESFATVAGVQTQTSADIPVNAAINASVALGIEEGKLRTMADTIRSFVRAADPSRAQVVPLRHGNVVLQAAEIEAFRADYGTEKSFRADYVGMMTMIVAAVARIESELSDFNNKQSSAYLWKPHADSMTFLVDAAARIASDAQKVIVTAGQRGLLDKVAALKSSIARLAERAQTATITLSQIGMGR